MGDRLLVCTRRAAPGPTDPSSGGDTAGSSPCCSDRADAVVLRPMGTRRACRLLPAEQEPPAWGALGCDLATFACHALLFVVFAALCIGIASVLAATMQVAPLDVADGSC